MKSCRDAFAGGRASSCSGEEVLRQLDGCHLGLGQCGHHVRGDAKHGLPLCISGDGGGRQAQDILALDAEVRGGKWNAAPWLALHAKLTRDRHLLDDILASDILDNSSG